MTESAGQSVDTVSSHLIFFTSTCDGWSRSARASATRSSVIIVRQDFQDRLQPLHRLALAEVNCLDDTVHRAANLVHLELRSRLIQLLLRDDHVRRRSPRWRCGEPSAPGPALQRDTPPDTATRRRIPGAGSWLPCAPAGEKSPGMRPPRRRRWRAGAGRRRGSSARAATAAPRTPPGRAARASGRAVARRSSRRTPPRRCRRAGVEERNSLRNSRPILRGKVTATRIEARNANCLHFFLSSLPHRQPVDWATGRVPGRRLNLFLSSLSIPAAFGS